MKKLIGVFLAAAALASLVGCSTGNERQQAYMPPASAGPPNLVAFPDNIAVVPDANGKPMPH